MNNVAPTPKVRGGLRLQMMGAFALLAVTPILVLGGLAIRNARRDVQGEVVQGNLAHIRAIGQQLNSTLQDTRRAISVAAAAWAQDHELAPRLLLSLRAEFSILRHITVLDRQGKRLEGDPLPGAAKFSLELANTYGGYVSEVRHLQDRKQNRRQVLMVVQARDHNGELRGFLGGVVDLSFVQERLAEARLGPGAVLFVVDGNGQLVASTGVLPPQPPQMTLRAANPAVNQVLATHTEGYQEFVDHRGDPWIAVYRNIAGMSEFRGVRWGVVLVQPTRLAYALARITTRDTIIVALLVLVLAWAAGGLLARKITRPLAHLVRQTKLVAAENFEGSWKPDLRRDEIGVLSTSFADMVHKLRRSRDKLYAQTEFSENLVQSIPIGVIAVDAQGVIFHINPAQERLSEVLATDVLGQNIAKVFPVPSHLSIGLADLEQVLLQGKNVDVTLDQKPTPFTKEPRLRYRIHMAPLRNRAGEVDGAVVLQEDLSERARLEAQLLRSEKLSSIGVLAAGVAHEINNPLTTILGYAKLLLEGREPEDADRPALELVADEARRVQEIVRNMLDFSRQETGQMVPTELNPVVERILSLAAPDLRRRRVSVTCELSENLPLILADCRRIEQVFVNLVNNAAQAMPSGGELTIRTGVSPARDIFVFAEFADTGTGIPAEVLPRIFDPFFTTKEPGQGTGLGLAVSHGIVGDHGGEIEVSSQQGEGSTFRVWLRRVDD